MENTTQIQWSDEDIDNEIIKMVNEDIQRIGGYWIKMVLRTGLEFTEDEIQKRINRLFKEGKL